MEPNWFTALFQENGSAHTIILFCLAIFPGLWLGEFPIFGVKLGTAAVLFSALAVGAFDLPLHEQIIAFTQNFGLILFVFAVGLQAGRGFFSSLKADGLKMNLFAVALILGNTALTILARYLFDLSPSEAIGVLAGATTNTPSLGAAQEALKKTVSELAATTSGTGYAVGYPVGLAGLIISIVLIRKIFRIKVEDEQNALIDKHRQRMEEPTTFPLHVQNPGIDGKTPEELRELCNVPVVFSRIQHGDKAHIPDKNEKIHLGDHLQVDCTHRDLERVINIIGGRDDPNHWEQSMPAELMERKILVSKLPGYHRLHQFRLEERFNVRITRIFRTGLSLIPTPTMALNVGDFLQVVGSKESLEKVAQAMGDQPSRLEHPRLFPIFIGILLGIVLGSVPIAIPGLPQPLKLGLAGGAMLVAIFMGAVRRIGPIDVYLSRESNLMLREIGIILFLAAVGLNAGPSFAHEITSPNGWLLAGVALVVNIVPVIAIAALARLRGMNYLRICGLLTGSMTNTSALGYVNSFCESSEPSIAHASVYPFTVFLRVILAQILVFCLV